VPEALAFTKYVKDDVFDPNLDSTFPDHVHHLRRVRIATKDRRTLGEVDLLDLVGHALKLIVGEPGEGRIELQEARCVDEAKYGAYVHRPQKPGFGHANLIRVRILLWRCRQRVPKLGSGRCARH
jgi:hypothetical protein